MPTIGGGEILVEDGSSLSLEDGSGALILESGGTGVFEPPPSLPGHRDGPVYEALAALLQATQEFEAITTSLSQAQAERPGDVASWAHIQQGGAQTRPDANPDREFRVASYLLYVETRLPGQGDPYDEGNRVESSVRNALMANTNRAYAGYCIPRHSRLTRVAEDYSSYPTVKFRYAGQFAYVVDMADSGYLSSS